MCAVNEHKSEWTIASAFRLTRGEMEEIVAVGLGTRVIGEATLQKLPFGGPVSDLHAEVLARRAFRRYLLEQAKKLSQGGGASLFVTQTGCNEYGLIEGTQVTFYSSALPCGDCQIFDVYEGNAKRRKITGVTGCPPVGEKVAEKMNTNNDKGLLRVKGGRGDPTMSMSCTDKIAAWLANGVRGALLAGLFPQPIFIDHIVIASSPCLPDVEQIATSLFGRDPDRTPTITIDTGEFCFAEHHIAKNAKSKVVPASACAVWFAGQAKFEQLDGKSGLRQGTSKKARSNPASFSLVSRIKLAQMCKSIQKCKLEKYYDEMKTPSGRDKPSNWSLHPRDRDHFVI